MRAADLASVTVPATLLALLMGAPVLRAPSERIFGMDIVGRHHDPFTVMQQFEQPVSLGVYGQPVTDVAGAMLARITGGVAAYNWLVLLSFPLAAAAAYLLARHLRLSHTAAAFAALAFAFAPFHVAQAAYHPHVAQTHWIPLFLLALWRCLDRGTLAAAAFLGAATTAVALSNFYAGLTAAVITPVAVAAYWFTVARYGGAVRRLVVTLATLGVLAAAGLTYVWWAAGAVVGNRAAFAFPRDDLFLYSAKWWSYLVPPVAHPLAGGMATDFWERMGIREGLLEQQVTLGWGLVALAGVAIFIRIRDGRPAPAHARIPVLVTVAAVALVCSLSPERTVGGFTFTRPSSLLYDVLPMFRAYARFGVVVQLMAALLAGMGVDWLLRDRAGRRQAACAVLVALVAIEYAVWPPALWRDVLPTAAHRWAMQQQGSLHVLDCTPADQESASVHWLTGGRISALGGSMADCGEPNLAVKLANSGYTHLLARGERDASGFAGSDPAAAGFRLASRRTGGVVFEVTAGRSAIYTSAMTGLFPRERNPDWSWRWMGERATWTVVNTGVRNVDAGLDIEMASFHQTRRVDVLLNGRHLKTLSISPERRMYRLDMTRLAPGDHQLVFHPVETATVVNAVISSGDTRALSVALGRWTWDTTGGSP